MVYPACPQRNRKDPLSREEKNKIAYIVMCVFLFASRTGMTRQDALLYLLDRGGIDYLDKHYQIEHTLPIEDTIECLESICQRFEASRA